MHLVFTRELNGRLAIGHYENCAAAERNRTRSNREEDTGAVLLFWSVGLAFFILSTPFLRLDAVKITKELDTCYLIVVFRVLPKTPLYGKNMTAYIMKYVVSATDL